MDALTYTKISNSAAFLFDCFVFYDIHNFPIAIFCTEIVSIFSHLHSMKKRTFLFRISNVITPIENKPLK